MNNKATALSEPPKIWDNMNKYCAECYRKLKGGDLWQTMDKDKPESWPDRNSEFIYLYYHSPRIARVEQRQWTEFSRGWHGTPWRKVIPGIDWPEE